MIDPKKVERKEEHAGGQKKAQESLANMDATIYRLNLLCNRFEKDKDLMLKEGVEIVNAVQSLQKELKAFAEMRGEIGEVLSNKIDQASRDIYHAAEGGIKEALRKKIGDAAYRLDEAVDRTTRKIQYFYDLDKKRIVWIILGLTILPVITGVVVAKLLCKYQLL